MTERDYTESSERTRIGEAIADYTLCKYPELGPDHPRNRDPDAPASRSEREPTAIYAPSELEAEQVEDTPKALAAAFRSVCRTLEPLTEEGRTRVLGAAHALFGRLDRGA